MAEIPFPGGAADGDVFFHEDKVCVYHKNINTWECRTTTHGGKEIGLPEAVTTRTVFTIPLTGVVDSEPPDLPDLRTQFDVNWFLSHNVLENQENIEHILWVGEESPPPEHSGKQYLFWWDTENLELLTQHNGQWFPVAIPPAQVELLRAEIDALYQDTSQNRFNIALTQQELDGKVLELTEARESLKSEYDGKLATLEEELEQLAPSLERGSWTFTLNHPPGPGEYTMISAFLDEDDQEALCTQALAECQSAAGGDPVAGQACSRDYQACLNAIDGSKVVTTDDWTQCDELVFNNVDMNGVTHGWGGINSDHYIDVFNMNDENYMVGDIATHGGGTFAFDLVSSRGVASGLASVKIFKAEGEVDFDQYVRKAGDDMTGPLHIKADTSDSNPAFLLEPDNTSSSYSDIMQVRNNEGTLLFYVTNGGTVSSGGSSGYKPSADHHLATKKYVDDQDTIFKPAKYGWKVGINSTNTPAQGYVSCSKGRIEGGVKFKFNLKSMEGGFNMKPFSPSGDVTSKEIYRYTGSSGAMTAMVLTAWVYQSGGTQMWKGTGEVRDILLKEDCLEVSLNSHYKNNGTDFDSSSIYYFTIGGFF